MRFCGLLNRLGFDMHIDPVEHEALYSEQIRRVQDALAAQEQRIANEAYRLIMSGNLTQLAGYSKVYKYYRGVRVPGTVLDLINDTIDYEDLDAVVYGALIAAANKGDAGCQMAIRALADKFAYHATEEV